MQKLTLFLLSILTIFIPTSVFAETITFSDLRCQNISPCGSKGDGSLILGIPESNRKNLDDFLLNTCKALSNNNNATYLGHSIYPASSYIVYSFDYVKFYAFLGNKLTSITCEIPKPKILGCTNPEATNYNSQATEDDNSCIIPPPKVPGCTNPSALNYNPNATEDNGTCQEKIEGCTDTTAINYNPQANVHKESLCQYTPPYSPQDITGAFEKSQVSIGSTTWTVRFNLNLTGAILDPSTIQTWNKFTAVDSTTSDKTLTITLRQFDDQRLDVECTNYEITIPRRAITTPNGDTNPNPISGNFEVVGCKNTPNTQGEDENTGSGTTDQPKYENTIKENNFYLSLYDTDEKGKIYLNLTNIIYLLGFLAFFSILFFVLFGFIKNSFLGKQQRR